MFLKLKASKTKIDRPRTGTSVNSRFFGFLGTWRQKIRTYSIILEEVRIFYVHSSLNQFEEAAVLPEYDVVSINGNGQIEKI
ncbi:hypothetical protein ACN6MY_16690 [Peribacillus sp. B-H-3]|uniref:hypothetical protein n=1 Tax=Peribacillus sp. B-H-3 TaxID=3400420 RepID=UPI003B02E178